MRFKSRLISVSLVFWCLALSGCPYMAEDIKHGSRRVRSHFVDESEIFNRYSSTVLKSSTSADILNIIQEGQEFVSQSESVVASWAEAKKSSILWFNMVAFDEEELTAVRKYGFLANEKVKSFHVFPTKKLRFDAAAVLETEIIEEPYANENEKRIKILRVILESFSNDMLQISMDSQVLRSSSMMVKQVLNTILVQLDQSPALAARLSRLKGMSFDHITLGPGRVRVVLTKDIVKIKIKVGKDWFGRQRFEKHPDVIDM